jgi:hypothetical protein
MGSPVGHVAVNRRLHPAGRDPPRASEAAGPFGPNGDREMDKRTPARAWSGNTQRGRQIEALTASTV